MKRIFIAVAFILFAAIVQAQNVGIGTATPVARLQINHRSSTTVGLQLLDSTPLRSGTIRFSTINNPVGITIRGVSQSSFNKDHYLDILSDSTFIVTFRGDGNVGIGTFSPTAKLDVNGGVKLQGINTLEFGAGVSKEINAGKIGYQTFTAGALDIVGAGTTVANRKVNIFAEGGTTFNGQIKITGGTPASGKVLTSDATGLASWQSMSSITYFPSVSICCQRWMTKNLDVDRYRNGDPIPKVENYSLWGSITVGAYCYYNNDSTTYAGIYGKLYNWYAVNDPRGLAPEGWYIPTDFEWTTLENCLGGATVAGGALKEIGITHWTTPNNGATNISGFTGLPGGFRNLNGTFSSVRDLGYWWSSTEFSIDFAWLRNVFFNDGTLIRNGALKQLGFSVRCLRD